MCSLVTPSPSPRYVPEPRPQQAPAAREPAPFAPITTLIIALNIVVFVAELVLSHDVRDLVFFSTAKGEHALLQTGGNYWWATIHEGRYETLLSSCFVHGGLLHIGFNMVALRQVGPFVERVAGPARLLPLYLLSGIVGSFVSTFYHVMRGVDNIGVGASGAVCGLIGAALVIGYRVQGKDSPILRAMASWLGTILLIGLIPGIDGVAHAGGAGAGAVIALLWRRGFVYSTARRWVVYALCALVLVATTARVAIADLTVPFATYTFSQRLEVVDLALRDGDCATARGALRAAKRLLPEAPEITAEERLINRVCP